MRRHRGRVLTATAIAVLGLISGFEPAGAKGGPTESDQLFVRTTRDHLTIRVRQGTANFGAGSGPCKGLGCPPPVCVPTGTLVIGFSTKAAVGQGYGELYQRDDRALRLVGFGGFGFEFDEPSAYIAAQTGPKVRSVRVRFRDGGSDQMAPDHHLVVLAASVSDRAAVVLQRSGPIGTVDAFDEDGKRIAHVRFSASAQAPTAGPPDECVGGLDRDFPKVTGDPPDDEPAARNAITFAFATAYGPGLDTEQRAALIEGGSGLISVMKLAADRNPGYGDRLSATVDEIRFIDAEHAAVRFSLNLDGNALLNGVGRAVLVGDEWLVARGTYCRLQQLGGVWCPDRDAEG